LLSAKVANLEKWQCQQYRESASDRLQKHGASYMWPSSVFRHCKNIHLCPCVTEHARVHAQMSREAQRELSVTW
jgi:hypothetical protein